MWTLITIFVCLSVIISDIASQDVDKVIVSLPNGRIRGRVEVSHSNVTFYAFDQVPYAQPPIGKLRFMAPQPVENWNDILNCTVNTKICRQIRKYDPLENEDCLYLNVYTPVVYSHHKYSQIEALSKGRVWNRTDFKSSLCQKGLFCE